MGQWNTELRTIKGFIWGSGLAFPCGNGSDLSHNLNCTFSAKKAFLKREIHFVVNTEKRKCPEQVEDQNSYEESGINAHFRRVGQRF